MTPSPLSSVRVTAATCHAVQMPTHPDMLSNRQVMTGLQLLALADDLTGAMEVGAQFAARGIAAVVTTEQSLQPLGLAETVRALVIDTGTRHLAASEAGQKVRRLACAAKERAIPYIFKKTDSTLRGNIGSEIGALMAAFPGVPLVYVPAYPRMGRTVRDGILYVDEVPVSETGFGADRLNPVRTSAIPRLLQEDMPGHQVVSTKPGEAGRLRAPAVYVVDGETEDDLRTTASGLAGSDSPRLAAGPAGFAGHLADHLPLERSLPVPWPSVGSCLAVCGSLHEVSRRQFDHALSSGWQLSRPERAIRDLGRSRWVLTLASDFSALSGEALADCVGRITAQIVDRSAPDALFVFGGDTAGGILRALGNPMLRPVGEILPGVPLAFIGGGARGAERDRKEQALVLIAKAGGFGPPDILAQVRARLGRN